MQRCIHCVQRDVCDSNIFVFFGTVRLPALDEVSVVSCRLNCRHCKLHAFDVPWESEGHSQRTGRKLGRSCNEGMLEDVERLDSQTRSNNSLRCKREKFIFWYRGEKIHVLVESSCECPISGNLGRILDKYLDPTTKLHDLLRTRCRGEG